MADGLEKVEILLKKNPGTFFSLYSGRIALNGARRWTAVFFNAENKRIARSKCTNRDRAIRQAVEQCIEEQGLNH